MTSKSFDDIVKMIEAYIFSAGQPVTENMIKKLFPEDEQPTTVDVRRALETLANHYHDRGVILHEVGSGFRFQVADDVAPHMGILWAEKPQRYSRALLETLALIAYRQPITRGEIEDIRGVVVSTNIIKTLLEQEWIRAVGHRDVPGRPALYATTKQFLDHFNMKSLEELPSLAEVRDLQQIEKELIARAEKGEIELPEGQSFIENESQPSEDTAAADASDIEDESQEITDEAEVTEAAASRRDSMTQIVITANVDDPDESEQA